MKTSVRVIYGVINFALACRKQLKKGDINVVEQLALFSSIKADLGEGLPCNNTDQTERQISAGTTRPMKGTRSQRFSALYKGTN